MQNFKILHETKTRLRLKIVGFRDIDASALQKAAARLEGVTEARFNAKIGSLTLKLDAGVNKAGILRQLAALNLSELKSIIPASHKNLPSKNEFILALLALGGNLIFRTSPLARAFSIVACMPILKEGIKESFRHGLTSKGLEAAAVGISLSRGDVFAANSTNTMLALGEYIG